MFLQDKEHSSKQCYMWDSKSEHFKEKSHSLSLPPNSSPNNEADFKSNIESLFTLLQVFGKLHSLSFILTFYSST